MSFEWVPSCVGMTRLWVGNCVEWVVLNGLCELLVGSLLRRDDKIVVGLWCMGCVEGIV